MATKKETGLAAIARSSRKASTPKAGRPASKGGRAMAGDKPALQFEGRQQKTSLALDAGLWNCVLDTAHDLSKRLRTKGRGRVTLVSVLEAAFVAFHELPIEQQIELIGRRQ